MTSSRRFIQTDDEAEIEMLQDCLAYAVSLLQSWRNTEECWRQYRIDNRHTAGHAALLRLTSEAVSDFQDYQRPAIATERTSLTVDSRPGHQ